MEGTGCGMICAAIPAFVWKVRGSSQKIYMRIICLWSQNWTQAAPGLKQKCHIWVGIFFFTLDLFAFCVMLITHDIYHQASACYIIGQKIFHMLLFQESKWKFHLLDYCHQLLLCCVTCLMLNCFLSINSYLMGTHLLNYEKSFFSLCVCLTEYTISLDYHKRRKWGVTHSVAQEYCIHGNSGMMILSQIFYI
jgi:hypothetical protein